MNTTQNLLDFILNLLRDSDAKAAFVANPDRALADAGLGDVCSEDVSDAMSYVADYHPVSFVGDRDYNVGNTSVSQHASNYRPEGYRSEGYRSEGYRSEGYAPDSHAAAVHQLEYISNNYSYTDSHDTVIDKSVNENIWNTGSLTQRFDDHSVTATDHSVAAGRDINGDVANGNDNLIGDNNSVGNTSYHDDHSDDHSIRGSFDGNNIADHGGVAGTDNNGNVTNPHHSDIATTGATLDESKTDSHDTTVRDSFNDSHRTESQHITNIDSNNDEAHYKTTTNSHNHESLNENSFNHEVNNDQSYNHDTAITETHQDGLLNANVSPAVALPIHDNDLDLLSHNN